MTKLKNIAVALASIVIFTSVTNAQAIKASYSVNSVNAEEPMAVKYLGNDGDYLTFQVSVKAEVPANAYFAIDDKNEGQLYAANVTAAFKVKTVKIEKRDDQVLNFKLVIGGKTYSKSFSVNTNLVEKTTVSESNVSML